MSTDPLRLAARSTALVLIDLQNGIMGRALAPYDSAQILATSLTLAKAVTQAGGTLALVHVGWSAGRADSLAQPVDAPNPVPPGGIPADWSSFVPEVAALSPDIVILKRHWGAFTGTELDLQLRRRGIDTVVIGGIATNFGVESTAREAWQANYAVVIAQDACASMSAEMHQFSIESIMPRIARVRSAAEIAAALG